MAWHGGLCSVRRFGREVGLRSGLRFRLVFGALRYDGPAPGAAWFGGDELDGAGHCGVHGGFEKRVQWPALAC
jgi:hypothetical protein